MFDWLWQSFTDWFYISPFWMWVWWAFLATCLLVLIGWFFAPLRSFCGALILAIIAGLSGYRRAQYDDEKHQKEIEERNRNRDQQPWWPWS